MTDEEFTHLLGGMEEIDSDLAAHLKAAKECIDRPGPMNLKLAAHAVREFCVVYPVTSEALRMFRRLEGGRSATSATTEPRRQGCHSCMPFRSCFNT